MTSTAKSRRSSLSLRCRCVCRQALQQCMIACVAINPYGAICRARVSIYVAHILVLSCVSLALLMPGCASGVIAPQPCAHWASSDHDRGIRVERLSSCLSETTDCGEVRMAVACLWSIIDERQDSHAIDALYALMTHLGDNPGHWTDQGERIFAQRWLSMVGGNDGVWHLGISAVRSVQERRSGLELRDPNVTFRIAPVWGFGEHRGRITECDADWHPMPPGWKLVSVTVMAPGGKTFRRRAGGGRWDGRYAVDLAELLHGVDDDRRQVKVDIHCEVETPSKRLREVSGALVVRLYTDVEVEALLSQ